MKRYKVALFFILIITAMSTHAEEQEDTSTTYNECLKKSGGVTVDMLNCQTDEYSYQNQRLHSNYQKLLSTLNKTSKIKLNNTQKDWQKYTQTTCDFYNTVRGGTMISIIAKDCFISNTKERANLLEYWFDLTNN